MKKTFVLIALILFATMASSAQATTTQTDVLTWGAPIVDASHPAAVSYNVYRATVKGGPYTKLTATPVTVLTYSDPIVNPPAGQVYYYVITAVAASGAESVNSVEINTAAPNPPTGTTTKIIVTVTTP